MSYSALFNEKSTVEDDKYYVTADPARVDVDLTQSEVEEHEQTPAAPQMHTAAVTPAEPSETTDDNVPDNTNHNDPVIEHEEEPKPNTQDQDETKHVQLSRSGNAEAAGLQNLNNAPDEVRGDTQREKDKKDREFNTLLQRLKEHRLWIMGIMNDIQDDIDKLTADIEEYGRVIEALQDFKDGKIAWGDDGYPDNKKAKTAIKEWERKNGKKWDPDTQEGMAAIDIIILSETKDRNELIKQRSDKQTEWNRWNDEWNATDEMINQYSDAQYANSSETQNTQNFADRMDKLREQEKLKQQQEALENTEGATVYVDAENNSLTTASDIFNSAPGVS